MRTRTRTSRLFRLLSLAVALSALAAFVAAPSVGFAEECGYSACHNGEPIPGSETSPTVETTCVPTKPAVSGKLKVRRSVTFAGKLNPPPSIAATITLYYQRKVGKRYKAAGFTKQRIAAGTASYALRHKFTKRGHWRVRAQHIKADGVRSTSGWRQFRIR